MTPRWLGTAVEGGALAHAARLHEDRALFGDDRRAARLLALRRDVCRLIEEEYCHGLPILGGGPWASPMDAGERAGRAGEEDR